MKYIFGPESIWIMTYLLARILTKSNIIVHKSLDAIIANSWYWMPMMTVLLFAIYWIPFASNNWLMLRIWVLSLVFGHLTLEHLTSSYSQQGPGIGTTYLAGMLFIFVALIVGSIAVVILKMAEKF